MLSLTEDVSLSSDRYGNAADAAFLNRRFTQAQSVG